MGTGIIGALGSSARRGAGLRSTILVVDDLPRPRRALAAELVDAGFRVLEASDGVEGWESFRRNRPDLVITDMVMPHSDGMELLNRVRAHSEVPVIMFTAYGSVESAVSALKAGADEFVASADVELDELVELVRGALRRDKERQEPPDLERRLAGKSRSMVRMRARIAALAPLSTPVLVSGEPGTGRDTVVGALHEFGSTAGRPFIRIDAGAFGSGDSIPRGGAVYLDGVERLSPESQERWSKWVEATRAVEGSEAPRILASASDRLAARIGDGSFDRDLGTALLRFHIQLPPLSERAEDIPRIAEALVERLGEAIGRRRIRLSSSAQEFLTALRWPGNVAQLERALERAIAFTRDPEIRREAVEEVVAELEESVASIRQQRTADGRDALMDALRESGGNVTQTAELLGKSRASVYRLIEKHGIPLVRRS